ncbi:MAG: alpha/beta hydrolase [Bacteroidota bacterium]
MKILLSILGIVAILGIVYLLGPKPEAAVVTPTIDMSSLPTELEVLEKEIQEKEASIPNIKPDNEARIVWADSFAYKKSPYSLVYLHGFSASQGEGEPIHREFAKRYGFNMYLARLDEHGLEQEEAMLDLTAEGLVETAKEAVAIGEQIGEKVILMSTSTGGTLSLYIASENPNVAGQILYSPNIKIFDPTAQLLNKPWGLQIARAVIGGNYNSYEVESPEGAQYWTPKYRLESLVQLQNLLDATMKKETFEKVTAATYLAYYYKDEEHQDNTVSVGAMLDMFDQLGTPDELKRKEALTEVNEHALASVYTSEDIEAVIKGTFAFAEEVMGLTPVTTDSTEVEIGSAE